MKRRIRNGEVWEKKCSRCPNHIPDEYSICDTCFMGQFNFSITYDALDHLGMHQLIPYEEVLMTLRLLKDKTFVHP